MSDEIINVVIDPNLDSYGQFFDPVWAKKLSELVKGSSLKSAVETLLVSWRFTNGSHVLPWLMTQSLKNLADGEYEGSIGFRAGYVEQVIKGIVSKIESRMHYNLNHEQRKALKRAVTKIEKEEFQSLKAAESQVKLDAAVYWNFLKNLFEFQICLLGLQHSNYSSLFFAYEDFLANTIRTKEPEYTSKEVSIKDAFPRHFGALLSDYCWTDAEVDLARLVRHALAHNGGRYRTALDKYKARFVDQTAPSAPILQGDLFIVVDGKIQITPCNTKHLFGVLKDRVTKVVEELVNQEGPR